MVCDSLYRLTATCGKSVIDAPVAAILKMRRDLHKACKQQAKSIFNEWGGTLGDGMTDSTRCSDYYSSEALILGHRTHRRAPSAGASNMEF